MTGGREGSTSDGKDPWREREAIGTQQRPAFGFRSLPLSYLKSVLRRESTGCCYETLAALHSTNFLLILDKS